MKLYHLVPFACSPKTLVSPFSASTIFWIWWRPCFWPGFHISNWSEGSAWTLLLILRNIGIHPLPCEQTTYSLMIVTTMSRRETWTKTILLITIMHNYAFIVSWFEVHLVTTCTVTMILAREDAGEATARPCFWIEVKRLFRQKRYKKVFEKKASEQERHSWINYALCILFALIMHNA